MICCKCKEDKDISCFAKSKAKKSGVNGECKACHKIYWRDYYLKNKPKIYQQVKTRIKKLRKQIKDVKKELKCFVCEEDETCCLDFHHLDPNEKEIEMGKVGWNGWGMERIRKEMDKCIPLCTNCHRKLHAGIINLPQ